MSIGIAHNVPVAYDIFCAR